MYCRAAPPPRPEDPRNYPEVDPEGVAEGSAHQSPLWPSSDLPLTLPSPSDVVPPRPLLPPLAVLPPPQLARSLLPPPLEEMPSQAYCVAKVQRHSCYCRLHLGTVFGSLPLGMLGTVPGSLPLDMIWARVLGRCPFRLGPSLEPLWQRVRPN